DRHRLRDEMAVMDQRRYQLLRVDRLVVRGVLLAAIAQQMDEAQLRLDPLQVQRDAGAERGGGTEIAVERKLTSCAGRHAGRSLRRWNCRRRRTSRCGRGRRTS